MEYNNKKDGTSISASENTLKKRTDYESAQVERDKENGEITVTVTRLSYIPIAV